MARAAAWLGIGLGCLMSLASAACREQPNGTATKTVTSSATPEADAAKPLSVGERAPDVTLTLQNGKKLGLRSLAGQTVVVYFYPKDDTKGCTLEAQGIRDDYTAFEKANVRVFGVSTQNAASHQAFIAKHELPFDLVVDTDGSIARAFGVPLRGGVAARQTFLIDKQGIIKKTWLNVDPTQHSSQLLAAIAE